MSGLAALLTGDLAPGVYRCGAWFDADDLLAAAAPGRWSIAALDGREVRTRRDALVALGRTLAFPEHYGANLDALWDALRDLGAPTVVLWRGWASLAEADPAGLRAVLAVLTRHADEVGDLAVLLPGPGPDVDVQPLP